MGWIVKFIVWMCLISCDSVVVLSKDKFLLLRMMEELLVSIDVNWIL